MRRLLVAALVAVMLAGQGAGASDTLTIDLHDVGTIVDPQTAELTASVWCEPIETQTFGELRITLTMSAGARAGSGTGTTSIICDGVTRAYTVPVEASSARWYPGTAVAEATGRAEGYRQMTMCIENSSGQQECQTFTLQQRNEGSSTETVRLVRA